MNVECPKCGSEDAYFDGVHYLCPACDYEWEADNCVFETNQTRLRYGTLESNNKTKETV